MAIYQCNLCGYSYDEEQEGVNWDKLPDDWTCPVCGAKKAEFRRLGGELGEEPAHLGGILMSDEERLLG